MNGKQRIFYLGHLKSHYPDDWCLVLDADEVVEGLDKIKEFIQNPLQDIYSVHMEHFIGDLGHLDATHEVHMVPNRLFKISKAKEYPLHSHPILTPVEDAQVGRCAESIIWHLGHLPINYMKYIVKRYNQHAEDSVIHPPQFLQEWKKAHLFGQYPTRLVHPKDIPEIILKEFELDKDEFYFADRMQIEPKHFIMMRNWLSLDDDITNIVDVGCGVGHFGYAFHTIQKEGGYNGFDISKYAIENSPYKEILSLNQLDATEFAPRGSATDLTLFIDILEHLNYKDLDKVLEKYKNISQYTIFSIPFRGDPNLDVDNTHIVKETKDWWIKKLSEYFNIKDAPQDWLFNHQILIGEQKK